MRSWDFDLSKRCEHVRPAQCMQLLGFSCGNEDIDTFFHLEVSDYETELMAKTYAFTDPERGNRVVSVFSLSNDSIKTDTLTNQVRNRLQRCIPNAKRKHSYPAVLLGQLGVDIRYRGLGVGTQTLQYVMKWMTHPDNKTGCRFLVVDALNVDAVLKFYTDNGFAYLYPSEDCERDARRIQESRLRTRTMYCDLRLWLLRQAAGLSGKNITE